MAKREGNGKQRKTKRPVDVNQLAHFLGAQSTDERPKVTNGTAPSQSEISRVMAAMGRKGGKIGGRRRAQTMSPKQRQQIALKAARARWDKRDA